MEKHGITDKKIREKRKRRQLSPEFFFLDRISGISRYQIQSISEERVAHPDPYRSIEKA
jgi:hypothetical protein